LARVRAINPHAKFQSAQCHAESLHNLLTGDVSSVLAVECEEEEGFVNMAEGEYECGRNERWKTPNYSWLDLEEEDDLTMYHVWSLMKIEPITTIMRITKRKRSTLYDKSVNNSMENVWNSSVGVREEEEGGNHNIQSKKRKDNFQDNRKETYQPPA
jgi:hypothetical protein